MKNTAGWRDVNYYQRILNYPNVELIHMSIKPKEILEKCGLTKSEYIIKISSRKITEELDRKRTKTIAMIIVTITINNGIPS